MDSGLCGPFLAQQEAFPLQSPSCSFKVARKHGPRGGAFQIMQNSGQFRLLQGTPEETGNNLRPQHLAQAWGSVCP